MPSPSTLVTLEQAKNQLRIRHDEQNAEIQDALDNAQDIILRYLGESADEDWTDYTLPGAVRAAILRQLAFLWSPQGRGDQPLAVDENDHGLAPGVARLLSGYRVPTIA